jgi:AcrR family transcriptional regulator
MATESKSATTRAYRKRVRAQQEAQTRRRITEAAVKLHGTVGPARTTIKGVADEAGVQRATVYRHFPTEELLFEACSTHWRNLNPPPDPAAWASISDPNERLAAALAELYAWYGWAEPMLNNTQRDAPLVPAMAAAVKTFRSHFEALRDALLRGRPERGRARTRVAAAIGHALAFPTWRSLVSEQGLSDEDAVDLMTRMVSSAGRR